nr:carbohydrate kinase family protein [uncultured Schaedlerella sp.]
MKILGLGYPCMDMNILCPVMPGEDQLVEMKDVSLMGGGKVANAIAAAARLGASTGFIGAAGSDRYGRLCRQDLEEHGADVSRLEIREGHTALCLSIVDEEHRGKHYIESPATYEKMKPCELDQEYLETADYLMLFQMDETAVKACDIVRAAGGKVVVDGDEPDERIQKHLSGMDILIASEYYYHFLFQDEAFEKNLRSLSEKGPEIVLVTLGDRGCVGLDHGVFFSAEPFDVKVEDTTGAGDVFHGAFVYALSEGMSAKKAAEFASAVSAIKCTVLGGRTGMATRKGVEIFMETGEILPEDFEERNQKYRKAVWD